MPNWCYNSVRFQGERVVIEQIKTLFAALADQERQTGHGQLPQAYPGDEGHLFDTEWEGDELRYLTRWIPNSTVILTVALCYGAAFIHHYEEPCNGIGGTIIYMNGEIIETEFILDNFTRFR
jgi:hypothetical protein